MHNFIPATLFISLFLATSLPKVSRVCENNPFTAAIKVAQVEYCLEDEADKALIKCEEKTERKKNICSSTDD